MRKALFFLSASVMPKVACVTPKPTTAKPARKGHIFFASRAAKTIMDSDRYGIFAVGVELRLEARCTWCDSVALVPTAL